MFYRIFSLQPKIFESFWETSLIARGVAKEIISYQMVNWREEFGVGGYKQADDKPFGGGSGMVLQPDQIFRALSEYKAVSCLFKPNSEKQIYDRIYPNNSRFFDKWKNHLRTDAATHICPSYTKPKVTVMLTPRGFPLVQPVAEWLATSFDEINILCGRYEGFDARVSEAVDLELSIGNFVTNGGEVPAMALVEAVSRLLPDFVTKDTSILHDSFSRQLNAYSEQAEFVIGKRKMEMAKAKGVAQEDISKTTSLDLFNPFDDNFWRENILPFIEHPQFTRPEVWQNYAVPEVLLSGDHKKSQDWRQNWWKN